MMSPPGHHDSFSLPEGVTGAPTGVGHVDASQGQVHASAQRSPEGGLIKVEGDGVVYEPEGIKAKFTDRGAHVTRESGEHVSCLA